MLSDTDRDGAIVIAEALRTEIQRADVPGTWIAGTIYGGTNEIQRGIIAKALGL